MPSWRRAETHQSEIVSACMFAGLSPPPLVVFFFFLFFFFVIFVVRVAGSGMGVA